MKLMTSGTARETSPRALGLRITDQETARIVAIIDNSDNSNNIVGAGCLVTDSLILTCRHVVDLALKPRAQVGLLANLRLIGILGQPCVQASVLRLGEEGGDGEPTDLALLAITSNISLAITPMEFATPLRHGGKFSVLGFPGGDPQGRNVRGVLHAADAAGLVQMDGGGALNVEGGFSGAPVWSTDVGAFVGLVVTEISEARVAWCIPSRLLCASYNELPVRFRVPPSDRPRINDYERDDPNAQIYGTVSNNGQRNLTARIQKKGKDNYVVTAIYKCLS